MSFGNAHENAILDHILGGNDYTRVSTVWIALSTNTPTEAGSFAEPTIGAAGYARVPTANNSVNWPAAAAGVKRNGQTISFPEATATWGTQTHFAIMTHAQSGGDSNFMGWGQLVASKLVSAADIPQFAAGSLSANLD